MTTAHELFSHPEFALPITRKEEDYLKFVIGILDRYKTLLDTVTGVDDLSVTLRTRKTEAFDLCDGLCETVKEYLDGRTTRAFDVFGTVATKFQTDIENLAYEVDSETVRTRLYRVRNCGTGEFSNNDLFHVPFEKRHTVKTQRFSVPGLPCLYLSGSLYACWRELGAPPFHEIQVASFWAKDGVNMKLLDFGRQPQWHAEWIKRNGTASMAPESIQGWVRHIVLWPLMAMCSIKTMHVNVPFAVEYTIPQFLLQWVIESTNFDGIRCPSTRINFITPNPHWICNYIFPARNITSTGRCRTLCKMFKMTQPVSWQVLRAVSPYGSAAVFSNFDFQPIAGCVEPYDSTEFGLVQNRITGIAEFTRRKIASGDFPADTGDIRPSA